MLFCYIFQRAILPADSYTVTLHNLRSVLERKSLLIGVRYVIMKARQTYFWRGVCHLCNYKTTMLSLSVHCAPKSFACQKQNPFCSQKFCSLLEKNATQSSSARCSLCSILSYFLMKNKNNSD